MRRSLLGPTLFAAGFVLAGWGTPRAHAQATPTARPTDAAQATPAAAEPIAELNLLEAIKKGSVAVKAEGIGDGRVSISVTNRTKRPLRVILPPGIVLQGATGQMGGMGGGMGGMGGGMGGGGMGGGMGGGGMGGVAWAAAAWAAAWAVVAVAVPCLP